MIESQLSQLGFNKNEIKVYLVLFELGKSRAGNIIEKTGLHRNLVYTSLDSLVARELVTKTIVSGVAVFTSNSPEHLISEIERKKKTAQYVVEELKKKQEKVLREITVYEGLEGIKRATRKNLEVKAGETAYVFGASTQDVLPQLSMHWRAYHKSRVQKGIQFRGLYGRGTPSEVIQEKNELPLTETKYMPSRVDAPIWFNICGDLSSIVAVDKEPIAVNIKSQTIADGLKKYFQLLWNQEVQVESGTDALHRVYYDMLAELESGDEYFVLGVTHGKEPEKVLDFFDTYHAERLKKNVSVNMIVSPEAYETIVEQYKKLGDNDFQLSHIKKLASEHPQPFHIILFNNKTRILIYGEEPTVLYFDRPEMYEGFKGYFDTLWSQKTKTFQGKGAKEEAFEDIINTLEAGEEVLVMSIFNFDPEFASFIENFHIRRAKQGIRARFLFNHNAREMGERLSSIDLTDVAYMEKGFVTQSAFLIYKNKTLISLPNERTFIQIESQEATNSFRVYFEQQWHQETRVIRGAEAVKNIWLEAVEVGELRFIGARGYFVDRYPEMFAEIEKKAGQKKGLKWKNVVDTSAKNHKLNKLPWMEPRFNMKGSKNPNVIWLWGEKVAIANWTEDEPVVFISTNKHLVQSYQDYFDELWNQ